MCEGSLGRTMVVRCEREDRAKGVTDLSGIFEFARKTGFPITLRSAFSLGWKRIANDAAELEEFVREGLDLSPTSEVQLES